MHESIYIIFICILLLICILMAKKLYDFSIIILNIEESIEESLDILDEKYGNINKILKIPVFFDSVEIRNVLANIKECHSAILLIANKLTKESGMISEIKKESIEKRKETL